MLHGPHGRLFQHHSSQSKKLLAFISSSYHLHCLFPLHESILPDLYAVPGLSDRPSERLETSINIPAKRPQLEIKLFESDV
jgi:hypothetical protein